MRRANRHYRVAYGQMLQPRVIPLTKLHAGRIGADASMRKAMRTNAGLGA